MDTINEIPHMISGYIHAHHLCDWVLVDGTMATIETIGLYSQVFFPDAFQLKITRLKLLEFRKKLSDNLQTLTTYTTGILETGNVKERGGRVSRISIWPVTSAVRDELPAIPKRPVRRCRRHISSIFLL